MSEYTVLIVEDEKDIRDILSYSLKKEGFKVLAADNGDAALRIAGTGRPDVILLDLMLPGVDGLEVCRRLQREAVTAEIPVVMLTAKGEEVDRVVGLELGAADYVVKPFSLREVVLRIRGVLKRRVETPAASTLSLGGVRLDSLSHKVTSDGKEIDLTITEFRILQDLLRHTGQVRSRDQLLEAVWDNNFEGYARNVDSHIKRLRAKLGAAGDLVETVRGIGYRARSGNERH